MPKNKARMGIQEPYLPPWHCCQPSSSAAVLAQLVWPSNNERKKGFFTRNLEYFLIITNQHDQKNSSDAICGPTFSLPSWHGLKTAWGPQALLLWDWGGSLCKNKWCPWGLVSCLQHCPVLQGSQKSKQTQNDPCLQCRRPGSGSSPQPRPIFPAKEDRAGVNSSKNSASHLAPQVQSRKQGRTDTICYLGGREVCCGRMMAAWGRLAGGGLTCFSSAVQLCARY